MEEAAADRLLDGVAAHGVAQRAAADAILVLDAPDAHGGGVQEAVAVAQRGKHDKARAERVVVDGALRLRVASQRLVRHLAQDEALGVRVLTPERGKHERRVGPALRRVLRAKVDQARAWAAPPALLGIFKVTRVNLWPWGDAR